jgi:hypothetical protein
MGAKEVNEFDIIMSMSDLGKYAGKWIAVVGDDIVAIDETGSDVFKKAKEKYPDRKPFIMKVPRNEVMLL